MNVFACSKLFRKLLSVLILPTALILFTTCEVGLGASVDTQPPELTLDYPAGNNLAIMNSFTLSGKAKDETYVGSVEIKLTCNEGLRKGTIYGPFAAKLSENVGDGNPQSWSALINEPVIAEDGTRTYPIPDGSYTASITAYDSVKRSTSLSRVYNIDNTAPIVVLKRPINSDSFGQVVKVTGDISDANALKALYFTAYKKNSSGELEQVGTRVKKLNISGVGLEQIIAKKIQNPSTPEETELNAVYDVLYDSHGDPIQDVYFKIEVSDAAEEYNPKTPVRNGADAAETGNISNGYYIYKDIYSYIYSEGGKKLTNSDLVNIFNGEYGDKERAGEITSYLAEKMIKTGTAVDETKTPKFSLSPKNSPTFEVSGYKYDSVANSFTDISNGSKIAVTVSPGRDQFQLDSDSVRLVLDECNADGTLVHQGDAKAANEIVLVESQEKINAETNQTKKTAMQAVRNEAFKEGDNIRITVSIGNRLSNRFYRVRVDGKDIEGHSIEASDGVKYGFKVVPTGAVPVVKITGGTEDYKKQNTTTVNYSGKISTSAAGVTLSCIITAQASNGSGTKIASNRISITPGAAPDFAWNVNIPSNTPFFNLAADGTVTTVPATINNNLVYIYTVSFTADDADGARSLPTERHIYVDTQNPVFDTSEPIKAKSGSDAEINIDDTAFASKWFTRNEITITGKAKDFDGGDAEVNKIQSYGLKIGTNAELPFPTTNDTGNFTLLASFTEGINHVLLSAYDLAGNKITKQFDIKVDNTAPALTSAAFVGNATTRENNISVKVEASDAKGTLQVSGLDKILIGKTPNFAESAALANISASGASPYTVNNVDISSLPDGKHTLYARVIDKAGLVSQEAAIPNLIVDRTAPVIAYTYPAANASVNKTIDLSGTITDANIDASSAVKLYQRINPAGTLAEITGVTSTVTTSTTPVTWKITGINTTSLTDNTKYDFQVRITDKAGNTTPDTGDVRTLEIKQNGDRPIVTLDAIKTDGTSTLGGSRINFSIEDDDGAVNSVKVQVLKGAEVFAPTDATKWKPATLNADKWTYEIPVVSPATKADGNYKICFKIEDAKGATFTTKSDGTDGLDVPYIKDKTSAAPVSGFVKFSVDTEPPVIDSVEVQFESKPDYEPVANSQKYGGTTFKKARFRIKASDTVTSHLEVHLKIEGFYSSGDLECSTTLGDDKDERIRKQTDGYETMKLIDFSAVPVSGMKQLIVTVKDNAGLETSVRRTIIVDNAAPDAIKNVTPRPTDEVTGEVIMGGLVQDDNDANSGIPAENAMKYYIPKWSDRGNDAKTVPDNAWKKDGLTQNSISWKLTLNDLKTEYTDKPDYAGYETSTGSGLYQLPVWFRVIDNVGNVGYIKQNSIKYNPDADKPRAVITYPVATQHGTTAGHIYDYVVLGKKVRFTGSASDNEGIDSVYLQFDMNGDGNFDNTDITALSGISGVTVATIPRTSPAQQGVKATGTVSWSYELTVEGLTGLSYTDDGGKTLGVRAIAVDNDTSTSTSQLAGAWSDVLHISINNSVPSISAPKLIRYANTSHTGTSVQERAYDNDMFISGSNWCIEGEVFDADDIKEINVTGSQSGTHIKPNLGSQESWFTKKNSDEKTYTYKIPINASNGKWEIELEVYDDDGANSKSSKAKYTINIDNTAPEFRDGANENTLVLYKDGYGTDGTKLDNSTNFVRNSNGSFTISSKTGEAGSGFERAVFYVKRNGNGTTTENRVYNVMEEYGANRRANLTKIEDSKAADKVYINAEGLPALYKHSVTRADVYKISFTGLAANKNIRNGGLVKIGGSYHRINAVTGDTVSITPECAITFEEAEFIYGMSVDNNGESLNGSTIRNDDGDAMLESYRKLGSDYIWDATFNSTHIPDGPIEIHVVVFDKAGNSRHAKIDTKVTNNPPRITSVKLGTDLNDNGTYEANESKTFYAILKDDGNGDLTKGVEKWNLDTKTYLSSSTEWTVKNNLSVEPEFVGGTSPYKYTFSKGTAALTTAEQTTTTATIQNKAQIILSNAQIVNDVASEDHDVYFRFSFWDSTEETNAGTNSQWTILNAKLHQNIEDNVPPTAVINPFYWVNSTDNSLYQNSKDNGHIELENDWQTASGYNSGATSGVSDKDPKVSGKIVVRGTVSDDVRLKEIKMAFDDVFGETPLSTYSNGAWSVYTPPANSGILAFKIEDKELSQNGHTAEWELSVDTSKLTGVTGTDKAITVKAIHAAATTQNSSTPGTVQTAAADTSPKPAGTTGYYRVDVVPYIAGINRNGTYNTNRARSGAIPLLRGEIDNTITGFNLKTLANSSLKINKAKDASYATSYDMTTLAQSGDDLTFTLPDTAYSGYLHLVINNVPALNNINSYTDYNTEKNDKAYDHNTLTDDRYVQVWRVSKQDTFKGSKNAIFPAMSKGSDGTLYASFSNYSNSQVYYSNTFTGNTDVTAGDGATKVFTGYDPPEETDITVNGAEVNILYAANYHGGSVAHWGNGTTSHGKDYPWNDTNPEYAGGIYLYDKDAASSGRHSQVYRFELFTYDNELQQFKNIRTVRSGDNIYVVYYDRLTEAAKFAWVDDTKRPDTRVHALPWCVIDGNTDITDTASKVPDHLVNTAVPPNPPNNIFKFMSPNASSYKTPYVLNGFEDGLSVSNAVWESIAVTTTKDGYPVVVYMDAATGRLRLARSKSKQPTSSADWKIQSVLDSSDKNGKNASDYINACIGSDGYLHIAFQNTKGQLVYVKSTNTSDNGLTNYTFGTSEVLDDSGMYIDMTINNTTPYITYVSRPNSYDAIRIAYKTSMDFSNTGTNEEGWETMTAPLNQRAANNRICIETEAKHYVSSGTASKMPVAVGFTTGSDYRAAFFVGEN
ncbi:MAG: hypothetical protein ACTTGZ_02200 [Treponema sp.]